MEKADYNYSLWASKYCVYPPRTIPGKTYHHFEAPDWESLFKAYSSPFFKNPGVIVKPEPPPKKSGGGYIDFLIENIAGGIYGFLGLFFVFGIPILMVEFIATKGVLTLIALVVGYLIYSSAADIESEEYRDEVKRYEQRTTQPPEDIGVILKKFCDHHFVELEHYPSNRVGRSAFRFKRALEEKGIHCVLEAVQRGRHFTFTNGTYSADIGYEDPLRGVLIDIEIDERHHFLDFEQWGKDNYRNEFFIRKGWAVLRFSEYQVLNRTALCVEDVSRCIFELRKRYREFKDGILGRKEGGRVTPLSVNRNPSSGQVVSQYRAYVEIYRRNENPREIVEHKPPTMEENGPIETIRYALKSERFLKIFYRDFEGKRSERVVRPIKTEQVGTSLYLIGYCHLRGEERTFAVWRIIHVEVV